MSGPEAGRRVPHAEPPLSAVLLEPLHLCEPRLHREARRGVVDGPGSQHHRLVGRRGEPVQCSCARLGGVPAPPRLRQEHVAELGLPGSRNLSPQLPCTVFPPARGEDEATCRQVPSPQLTSSGPASAIADTRCDQDPGHARPGPTHRSLNRIRAAQRRADHVSPADEAPPGVLLGEAAGLLPVAEKGCLTRSDVRPGAPLGQCRARLRRGVGGMRPPARRPCPRRGPARSPRCGGRSALACEG